MEKDIIRIAGDAVHYVCEECGKSIDPGSLLNEYSDGDDAEVMVYCVECVPSLVGMGAVWTREDNE